MLVSLHDLSEDHWSRVRDLLTGHDGVGDDGRHLNREPNGVERFFGRIKQSRQVANRSDKKAANFLSFFWVAGLDLLFA